MTVAERIKLARTKRGLTQQGLAVKAGLSKTYVLQAERAGVADVATIENPSTAALTKLARALDVPVAWLAFGTGKKPVWNGHGAKGAA